MRRWFLPCASSLAVWAALAACGSGDDSHSAGDGGMEVETGGNAPDADPNDVADATGTSTGGTAGAGGTAGTGGAGSAGTDGAPVGECLPPNAMILLDRSTSMQTGMLGSVPKWDAAVAAITGLPGTSYVRVRFGLSLYPGATLSCSGGEQCLAGAEGSVFVDPAEGTDNTMFDILAVAGICSYQGTPTAESLTSLMSYAGLRDATRDNNIILLTDDPASCADPGPVAAALLARVPSVKTFVIGLGDEVDPAQLRAIAMSAGTALPDPVGYYQVNLPEELTSALEDVIDRIACP